MSHPLPDLDSERSAATPEAMRADMDRVAALVNGRARLCWWHQEWLPGRPLVQWYAGPATVKAATMSRADARELRVGRAVVQHFEDGKKYGKRVLP